MNDNLAQQQFATILSVGGLVVFASVTVVAFFQRVQRIQDHADNVADPQERDVLLGLVKRRRRTALLVLAFFILTPVMATLMLVRR